MEDRFSEQMMLMSEINVDFPHPPFPSPDPSLSRSTQYSHARLALLPPHAPLSPTLYLCAQNPIKLHPSFDRALHGILDTDPSAVIVLLKNQAQPMTHQMIKSRLFTSLGSAFEVVFVSYPYLVSPSDAFSTHREWCSWISPRIRSTWMWCVRVTYFWTPILSVAV